MKGRRFYVLGPLMGGYGSKAFLGQELSPSGRLRPAVLIFLSEGMIEDQELFDRIREETAVAVRLDHLNIITILGLVKLEDGYARVVEFADGESLRSVFARARELGREIPPPVAAAILADACSGVHHAHQHGGKESGQPLLHTAVRPETILVTFRGIAMVTGYGTAAIMEGVRRETDSGDSGDDPYVAPELASSGREAAEIQSDVYGLGAVLHESLTGEAPVDLPTDPAEGLEGIILKAMATEPSDRFASAIHMREALLSEIVVATKREVAAFMHEIFPDDMPQIKGRRAMLKRGQLEYDADPPELNVDGPPETIDLVWRYPIREVSGPAPAPAKKAPTPAPVKKPPAPAPAKKLPEPAPAKKPPAPAPVVKRPAPVPPPPYQERKRRRISPVALVVIVLIAGAAFVLGLVFSDWGAKEEPMSPSAPATPPAPVQQPAPSAKSTTPPVASPATKKAKRPKKANRKKRLATRRSRKRTASRGSTAGTGYLNVKAPRGSKVYIRGRYYGTAPLKRLKLRPGRHKVVVVKKDGKAKYKRMVPISSGREMTLTVDFY